MDNEQRKEIREMVQDIVGVQYAEIIGRLNVLNGHIATINGTTTRTEKHAEKTNGRVTKLEDEVESLQKINMVHLVNCPNTLKIAELEKENLKQHSIKTFLFKSLGVTGIIVSVAVGLYELFKYLK